MLSVSPLHFVTFFSIAPASALRAVSLRPGVQSDKPLLLRTMATNLMNPLSLDPSRFLIAVEDGRGTIGFGQVRPLGDASSDDDRWCELASLWVDEGCRGEGIGSQLVHQLTSAQPSPDRVHLLTLASTAGFYERLGFRTAESPPPMQLELAAGTVVAGLARSERLVCMRWSDGDATAADAAVAAAPPQGQTRKSEPSPFVQYLIPYAGYGLLAFALASVAFAYLVLVG